MPLFVAPVLPIAQVGALRWLSAKHLEAIAEMPRPLDGTAKPVKFGPRQNTSTGPARALKLVRSVFHISHVTVHSKTHVNFYTHDGRIIKIVNAEASLIDPNNPDQPRRDLCNADAECASFTVAASAERGLYEEALLALIDAGTVLDDDIKALPIVAELLAGPLGNELLTRRQRHLRALGVDDSPAGMVAGVSGRQLQIAEAYAGLSGGDRKTFDLDMVGMLHCQVIYSNDPGFDPEDPSRWYVGSSRRGQIAGSSIDLTDVYSSCSINREERSIEFFASSDAPQGAPRHVHMQAKYRGSDTGSWIPWNGAAAVGWSFDGGTMVERFCSEGQTQNGQV